LTAFSETASDGHCVRVDRASASGAEGHGLESHQILFLQILSAEILALGILSLEILFSGILPPQILPPETLSPAILSSEIPPSEALTPGNPLEGGVGRAGMWEWRQTPIFFFCWGAGRGRMNMKTQPPVSRGPLPHPPPSPQRLHPGGVTYGRTALACDGALSGGEALSPGDALPHGTTLACEDAFSYAGTL